MPDSSPNIFIRQLPISRDDLLITLMISSSIAAALLMKYLILPKLASSWRTKSAPAVALPPGPYGLPIVGSLPFLESQLHRYYAKLAHTYGPIFKLRLGSKLCVVISSLPLVKEVTRDQDIIFAHKELTIAGDVFSEGGNDVVFSAYNPNWRKLRKIMVGQMLSNNNLDACYSLRREEVRKVVKLIYSKLINDHQQPGEATAAVNVSDLVFLTIVNANLSTMWGDTLKGEEGYKLGLEFRDVMAKLAVQLGRPNVSEYFPWLARFDLQGVERETKKICVWLDNFVNSVIDQRRKQEYDHDNHGKDLLQFLVDLKEAAAASAGESITWTQVKALLCDIVIGGTYTTATTVQWVMTELLNHPEMLKKVQQELIEVVGLDNNVEESHVFQLPYLEAVVMESFRLHPSVAYPLPRQPSSDAVVGGYLIPKDTRVFINIWAMHTDPKYWEDPFEFRPERFLNINKQGTTTTTKNSGVRYDFLINSLQYLPFGSGRRTCPGIFLAERMVRFTVASFVHCFDWKLPPGVDKLDTQDEFGAVVKKREPVIAIPSLRLSNPQLYQM